MHRWTTWPGFWLGLGTWLYAALAVVELRGLGYDPTAPPEPDAVAVAAYVPELVVVVAVVLGAALLASTWSMATGRGTRVTDVPLGLTLLLGAGLLWSVEQARPVAPWVVGGAGLLCLAGVAVRDVELGERTRSTLGRLLLALGAVPIVLVSAVQLDGHHWQLHSWTVLYWAGLGAAAALLLAAVVLRWRSGPVTGWSRTVAGLLLLVGSVLVVGGCLGFREGYLVSGHEESEDGWYLGGLPLFTGLGVLAAGVAATRARWSPVAASLGGAMLLLTGLVLGIDEMRRSLL